MADDHRQPNAQQDAPGEDKVDSRASKIAKDNTEQSSDDPQSQAEQILEESEERVMDPNAGGLDDDTVERRNVGDLTPDADGE